MKKLLRFATLMVFSAGLTQPIQFGLASDIPFFLANNAVDSAFNSSTAKVAKLAGSPCLTTQAKEHLMTLLKELVAAQIAYTEASLGYVHEMSKPMPGEGTCNGGFLAVANESKRRKDLTADTKEKLAGIERGAVNSVFDNLVNAPIYFNSDLGASCAENGPKQYEEIEKEAKNISDAFVGSMNGLLTESNRLNDFMITNHNLAQKCGSGEATQVLAAMEAPTAIPPPSNKRFAKPYSDVTGVKEDAEKRSPIELSEQKGKHTRWAASSITKEEDAAKSTGQSEANKGRGTQLLPEMVARAAKASPLGQKPPSNPEQTENSKSTASRAGNSSTATAMRKPFSNGSADPGSRSTAKPPGQDEAIAAVHEIAGVGAWKGKNSRNEIAENAPSSSFEHLQHWSESNRGDSTNPEKERSGLTVLGEHNQEPGRDQESLFLRIKKAHLRWQLKN